MDFVKSQFDRIQQQLNGLTPSQKMLTGTLVTIMVMTLVWWAKYAGQPEMEPLLSQALTDEDLSRITLQLDTHNIPHEVTADKKLLVAEGHRIKALATLGYAEMLPKDTTNGFDEIIKKMTPWDGADRSNMMFNRGKEMTLREMIRHFPDVADATVAIDPTRQRVIGGGGNIEPSAIVDIRMKNRVKPNPKLVKAAAVAVQGVQAGMQLKNVKVVVDGVPHRVRDADPDDAGAEDLFEIRQKEEVLATRKLSDHFGDIQGLLVAVTVDVEHKTTESQKKAVTSVLSKEIQTTDTSRESTAPLQPPAEPGATPNLTGVGSNTPVQIGGGGAGGTGGTQTESENKVAFSHYPTIEEERTKSPAGKAAIVGVSLRVPRSHFVRITRGTTPSAPEPSEAAVDARIEKELPRLRDSVTRFINIRDPRGVSVDPYFDQMPVVAEAPAVNAASSVSLALGGHTKEIVLGALALVSLFLVSTIVKKGMPTPAPVARLPEPRGPPPVLENGETVAGEAGEGNPMLDGMELDDDAVKTQQMLAQVSTMVDENPDAAAALVKRWLNRT